MFNLLESASTIAGRIDLIFLTLMAISSLFIIGISGLVIFFAVKYRRGTNANRLGAPTANTKMEIGWMVMLLVIGLPMFGWAAFTYFIDNTAPADALEIHVIAKQWMWKMQHPDGQREIDELHVPLGQPVKLLMISQDVIHSFWVPDFRLKQDVLPGRYTSLWFEATQEGVFPLRCAEYCGTKHSGMIGRVIVMKPAAYQAWLGDQTAGATLAAEGEQLFTDLGCSSCHRRNADLGRGPSLVGVFGTEVLLANGQTVIADESYIRESILEPGAKIVATYQNIMPSFEGQVSEEEILALISYVKSLSEAEDATP